MPHPFTTAPHRTIAALSFPTLISLIAEPLTGLVDTAFVARLGAEPLAALGVGTITLSAVFWIFNFLGIGTQTQVAQTSGSGDQSRSLELIGMALALAVGFGVLMLAIGMPLAPAIASAMGAEGSVIDYSVEYIRIRLWGGPAVLVTLVSFGVFRGLQDMRTPLWIALGINVLNIGLDAVLVFGAGPIPALGIAGAAAASVVSQWVGAIWALWLVQKRMGRPAHLRASDVRLLLVIGGDLFIRTGMLTAFLILTTRAATRMGAEAGAAHQAIRQFWTFAALLLDAYAIAGQSLVGYFIGSGALDQAKRVAYVVCIWSFWTGVALALVMWAGASLVIALLVPVSAVAVFSSAWYVAALFQPLNALSFATDGVHWGTGDFRYLRNVVIAATLTGAALLFLVDDTRPNALMWVWWITGVWIVIRAVFGMLRIWPGIGASPFAGD